MQIQKSTSSHENDMSKNLNYNTFYFLRYAHEGMWNVSSQTLRNSRKCQISLLFKKFLNFIRKELGNS